MNKAIEYEIGDVFTINRITVKCKKDWTTYGNCGRCAVKGMRYHDACANLICRGCDRKDSKEVYFEEVK